MCTGNPRLNHVLIRRLLPSLVISENSLWSQRTRGKNAKAPIPVFPLSGSTCRPDHRVQRATHIEESAHVRKLSASGKRLRASDGASTLALDGQLSLLSKLSASTIFNISLAFLGLLISILPPARYVQ